MSQITNNLFKKEQSLAVQPPKYGEYVC